MTMLINKIRAILTWLQRAATQPSEELNRWQRAARFAYDLGRFGAKKLEQDRAPQMAAALAFRTLFSLAPVLVVTTILVKAFRGPEAIVRSFGELLTDLGLDKIYVANVEGSQGNEDSLSLAAWLMDLTSDLMNTNLTAIGWVGLALILYAAIGLMVTIENSFNIIYRAHEGRPWVNRILLYWFILTLSPAMIALTNYVHEGFDGWIQSVDTWQWLLVAARTLWGFSLAWLFMLMVYMLLPNGHIRLRPAMVGSFVATLLLAIGQKSLGAYWGGAFSINQLYGALGLVPLFMFWVYLMWLVVLFGLQVAATLQVLRGRSLQELEPTTRASGMVDPTAVVAVMEVVGKRFLDGASAKVSEIASAAQVPEVVVGRIVDHLVDDGWLNRLEAPEGALSLAMPPDRVRLSELISTGFRMVDQSNSPGSSSDLVQELRIAQQRAIEDETLGSLLQAKS
jgi:membrane protein